MTIASENRLGNPLFTEVDYQQILTYFSYIEGSEEVAKNETYIFAFFGPKKKDGVIKGFSCKPSQLQNLHKLFEDIRKPFTLHTTLNIPNDKGRKTENMRACRCICVDLDKRIPWETLQDLIASFNIGMVVESSPDKYHLYWRLPRETSLDMWQIGQKAFANKFAEYSADPGMSQLAHIIRVPGVERVLEDNSRFIPRIVHLADTNETLDLVSIGWLDEEYNVVAVREVIEEEIDDSAFEKYEQTGTIPNYEEYRSQGGVRGRNTFIFSQVKKFVANLKEEVSRNRAYKYGESINRVIPGHLDGPMDSYELRTTTNSAYRAGARLRIVLVEEVLQAKILDDKLGDLPEDALNLLAPLATVSANGHGKHVSLPYNYDFSQTEELRDVRYGDKALSDRVLQKHKDRLICIKAQRESNLYAYSEKEQLWCLQQQKGANKALATLVNDVLRDVRKEPKYRTTFCLDSKGKYCPTKADLANRTFTSKAKIQTVTQLVLMSEEPRLENDDIFDRIGTLLFCGNGVIDLSESVPIPRPAVATDLLVARTSVKYNREATCPGWLQFLDEIFAETKGGAAEIVPFIQELFGYSLSGFIGEEKVFCHTGGGANGKSKLMQALKTICGSYATFVSPTELTKTKGNDKNMGRFGAQIEGKRVCIVDDMEVKATWDEGLLKTLTAKYMRTMPLWANSAEMANRVKMHMGTNNVPSPEMANHGLFRRLCFIPYHRQFEVSGEKEAQLNAMIEREAEGILAWAIVGFKRYWDRGQKLVYPKATEIASAAYRAENDPLEGVIKEMFGACEEKVWTDGWFLLKDLAVEVQLYYRNVYNDGEAATENKAPLAFGTNKDYLKAKLQTLLGKQALDDKHYFSDKNNSLYGVRLKKNYTTEMLKSNDVY